LIRYFYSKGIIICGFEGKALGDGNYLSSPDSHTFFDLVKKHLEALGKIKIGRKLLETLDGSGHTCSIFKAGLDPAKANTTFDSVTLANPPGAVSEVNCSVKHFAPRHHIMPLQSRGNPKTAEDNKPILKMANMTPGQIFNKSAGVVNYDNKTDQAQGFKQELQNAGFATSKSALAGELTVILKRTPFWMTRSYVAKKAGISEKELGQIERAEIGVNQETYYRLAILLYDYMTAGSGVDTQIRFRALDYEAETAGQYNPKTNYNDAPGYIILGHELIHAWRMMVGRRLVRQGWEEEAMTTGLYKFSELEFTENKLRGASGLPTRPKYQKGYCSSQWMDMVAYHNSH